MATGSELVVLSHLRWTFVWQRPQHLISRIAAGRRTWFVEEPVTAEVDGPTLCTEEHGAVTRVWLEVPGPARGFDDSFAPAYAAALADLLGFSVDRTVWLYTPMAMEIAASLRPTVLVYDVMDDLASFLGAPAELRLRHRRALRTADVVFTGGRSLYQSVAAHRANGVHLFSSGVEPEHFARARGLRSSARDVPVAGYVGVIDERLDLDLLAGLAAALPDWEIRVVGPVVKIDPASLPRAANLAYPGPAPYDSLPEVVAGFDVALMPFALNEATRSISPTKTLEYLAAGLPVVSTRVPDVVADHKGVVDLADDAPAFAAACRSARRRGHGRKGAEVDALLRRQTWDSIAARMAALLDQSPAASMESA